MRKAILRMKKEIIITIVTIIVIIIGDIITQKYTNKCVSETNQNLLELKEKILAKEVEEEELKNKSEEVYNKWREDSKGLAYYIEHDELEKVDVQIQIITANLEAETPENSIPEIEQAVYLLHHIEEKRALKLKNIF